MCINLALQLQYVTSVDTEVYGKKAERLTLLLHELAMLPKNSRHEGRVAESQSITLPASFTSHWLESMEAEEVRKISNKH